MTWNQATDPATLAGARRMYGRRTLAARPPGDAAPYWAMLHKITAKTLMTWGRDDRVSPLDMAIVPMRTIPDAELHVFKDGPHGTGLGMTDAALAEWPRLLANWLKASGLLKR